MVKVSQISAIIFFGVVLFGCTAQTDNARQSSIEKDERGYECPRTEYMGLQCYWKKSTLTYAFGRPPPKLNKTRFETVVHTAFGQWDSVLPITFEHVRSSEDPDILVSWVDEDYITTPLAVGDYPPGCGLSRFPCRPKPLMFFHNPTDTVWAFQTNEINPDAHDVHSVALHEIGHMIGVFHCDDPIEDNCESDQEVMQQNLKSGIVRRSLTEADIKNGLALYPILE